MAVLPANPSLRLLAPSLFLFRASVAVFALFATLIKCGQKITCTRTSPCSGQRGGHAGVVGLGGARESFILMWVYGMVWYGG